MGLNNTIWLEKDDFDSVLVKKRVVVHLCKKA